MKTTALLRTSSMPFETILIIMMHSTILNIISYLMKLPKIFACGSKTLLPRTRCLVKLVIQPALMDASRMMVLVLLCIGEMLHYQCLPVNLQRLVTAIVQSFASLLRVAY
ncbi:hypothetical protein P692DRAFT_20219781 [Suillus brevipes Sb2]|nr:hypothetical protein P692DRAFT_20219781 [Suillus brevipes Sb2]